MADRNTTAGFTMGRLFKANGTGYTKDSSDPTKAVATTFSEQIAGVDIEQGLAVAVEMIKQKYPDFKEKDEIYSITRVPAQAKDPDISIINTIPVVVRIMYGNDAAKTWAATGVLAPARLDTSPAATGTPYVTAVESKEGDIITFTLIDKGSLAEPDPAAQPPVVGQKLVLMDYPAPGVDAEVLAEFTENNDYANLTIVRDQPNVNFFTVVLTVVNRS